MPIAKEHKKILVAGFVTIIILAILTYFIVTNNKNVVDEKVRDIFIGQEEKPAVYTDLEGNQLSLKEYLGKIMVVTSWASWSPYSKMELELLDKVALNYDQEKVVFLAINRKESKDRAKRYINTVSQVETVKIILDPEDRFYKLIGGYAMPETIVYDKKGNVEKHFRGTLSEEELKGIIDKSLSNTN
ncbi:MAG: TlpA disulfide reductase family protein [Candidatus Paceibacterota bacterium]